LQDLQGPSSSIRVGTS
ncbi:40S ribosomal protein S9, partial [Histoplasma capsulatum]